LLARTAAVLLNIVVPAPRAAQAGPVTVAPGQAVSFRARVTSTGNAAIRNARVCVDVPRGFQIGTNPGATVNGRQVCYTIARLPAGATVTRVVRTTATQAGGQGSARVTIRSVQSLRDAVESCVAPAGAMGIVAQAGGQTRAQAQAALCQGTRAITASDTAGVRVRPGQRPAGGGGVTG
jgi:hypothetical protein